MGDDPQPTREGPLIVVLIIIFVIVSALYLLHIYGLMHRVI
jgi:hypothetical protein